MLTSTFLVASLQALSVVALPLIASEVEPQQTNSQLPVTGKPVYDWQSGYQSEWDIHASCNSTERREITEGLRQAVEMAEHAKNHSTCCRRWSQI